MKYMSLIFLIAISYSQSLQKKLETLISGFKGNVGIYVHHKNGEEVKINADTIFPTASMIKVPILITLFDRIEKGDYQYSQKMQWHADTVNYPYDGQLLWSFKEDQPIHLSEAISLMITYSDNHAALWCQKLAGGGERINQWLDSHGFKSTRMNSRTEGRRPDWQIYGWGQTTPYEMAQLILGVANKKWISPEASQEMFRVLSNIYWRGEALSEIPAEIQTISKQGAVNQSRSEVVWVNAPHGEYVFCVITKNQEDDSWIYENAGFILLREVSKTIWQYFETDYKWQNNKSEKYRTQYD